MTLVYVGGWVWLRSIERGELRGVELLVFIIYRTVDTHIRP
jgi:hypothetical protein